MRRILGVVLGLAACGGGLERGATRCEEAPTVGRPDGTEVRRYQRSLRTAGDGTLTGDPVAVLLPDDVLGVSITVDGGPAITAATRVTLDGRTVLDLHADPGFAQRRARVRPDDVATDTTGPDTFVASDTGWVGPVLDGSWTTPFYLQPVPAFTLTMPVSDATVPWAGCLLVTPGASGDAGVGEVVVHVATRRGSPEGPRVLDLAVITAGDTLVAEADLSSALGRADALLRAADLSLGDVARYAVDGPTRLPSSGEELGRVRATTLPGARGTAVPVILTEGFVDDPDTLGFAAGIPGPTVVHGTHGSAVVLSIAAHLDGGRLDASLLGETLAHEVMHQLALFHTTEAGGGAFDDLDDTPRCPADRFDADGDGEVSAEECVDRDGQHAMFWISGDLPQGRISAEQGRVLRRQPAARRPGE